jgi:hypothetical protein
MIINFSNNNSQENPRVKKAGNFITFAILIIMGWVLNYISSGMIKKGEESLKWPKTIGVVVESAISSHRGDDGYQRHSPNIVVKYNVNGNDYQTNQINASGLYSTTDLIDIQNIVSRYPRNKFVYVYYDDKNFSAALLEPGVSMLSRILQALAYFLFLLAFLILGKFIIIIGVVGIFIANFFSKKKLKNPSNDFKKNPDIMPINKAPSDNQNNKMNFKDDGFSQ